MAISRSFEHQSLLSGLLVSDCRNVGPRQLCILSCTFGLIQTSRYSPINGRRCRLQYWECDVRLWWCDDCDCHENMVWKSSFLCDETGYVYSSCCMGFSADECQQNILWHLLCLTSFSSNPLFDFDLSFTVTLWNTNLWMTMTLFIDTHFSWWSFVLSMLI